MRNEHHVVPNTKGGWDIKKTNVQASLGHYSTKKEAVNQARIMSRSAQSELVIHNKNGQIAVKDSHGHDPRSSKG
ncbi:DUF2188 domain-containing protein [Legionella sp. MW5194]|uniref:DUF2188 domain-containing protein n=1 Tax=Legionella sp. MW5194 TaxID=2662448 RepID=UPI00193CC5F8|nr:DUF2188 domain-containing protein [Legionella sp. MW5194]QRN03028.1 DUF2188 domain-containing protein [Legionella sp. MW5194]